MLGAEYLLGDGVFLDDGDFRLGVRLDLDDNAVVGEGFRVSVFALVGVLVFDFDGVTDVTGFLLSLLSLTLTFFFFFSSYSAFSVSSLTCSPYSASVSFLFPDCASFFMKVFTPLLEIRLDGDLSTSFFPIGGFFAKLDDALGSDVVDEVIRRSGEVPVGEVLGLGTRQVKVDPLLYKVLLRLRKVGTEADWAEGTLDSGDSGVPEIFDFSSVTC